MFISESSISNRKTNPVRLDFDLELPDGKGFVSRRVPIDSNLLVDLSEESLPRLNARPERELERLRSKASQPFELRE
jgi:hypothetical protein